MDKEKFLNSFAVISIIFPDTELTENMVSAYYSILKDIDIESFNKAVTFYLKTAKSFPSPSDLRDMALAL